MKLDMNTLPTFIFSGVRQFFPNEKHINRTFKECVLILMYKGVLRFNEGGKDIELNPGEYYFQIKNIGQKGIVASDSPHYYYIHFDATFSPDGHLPLRGYFDTEEMQPYLNELQSLPLNSTFLEKQKCFFTILAELLKSHKSNKTVEKIQLYLQENFRGKTSIKDLEEIVFLSRNQIINVFKEAFGVTPYRYITELRLQEACELLLSTTRTLSTIAANVGYSDYSIFYKAFYAKYKISPQEYRRLKNKNRSIVIGKDPSKPDDDINL